MTDHSSPDSELAEKIKKIDQLFEREEHDSGYQAFVHIRKIWPQIKAAALWAAAMRAPAQAAPRRVDDHMTRARRLVEDHIEAYGMVPHPDKIKDAISEQSQESFDLGFRAAGGTGPAPALPQGAKDD